ncbi:cytochrome P450 [Lophiotrema nucula]|uniref:Cytochrome P450 n=1 Tax=Lophiotrema nucula TaxID=690887 RepID=A0A6A5ZW19_9PLEO|nr:cytochrome P450 [Lophiotrema nucula]
MANILSTTAWDELIRSKPLAAGLGLFSHFVFGRGEWDHSTHLLLLAWMATFATLTVVEYTVDARVQSVFQALQVAGTAAATYLATLATSILIYRAFFHRLRKFPGPFAARLSKWWSLGMVVPKCQLYNNVEQLHKEYKSDIVRTGPRELSIISADAIPLVHSATTKCTKGPWYAGAYSIEGASTHTTRDKQDHKERRKNWDRAFNAKSLRDYEPRVNRHSLTLMERLSEHAHESSVRISDWLNYYSFDVIGDIGFSHNFGMLEKGKEDRLITLLHKSMAPVAVLGHLSWMLSVLTRVKIGLDDMFEFIAWTQTTLRERKKITPKENDIFSWLLDPNDEDIPLHLNADSRLLIVAGSDTTSATLTWLFYELCKHPEAQKKLQKAVDAIAPGKSFLDADDVANCPQLDGVIHEALRLHPAVPSGTQRETPPSGLTLPDQTFIPGNTLIWMPAHTLQRDARYFPSPLSFMPERWTSESPDYVADKRAFMAFSTGAYNCVGQKLSLMEMRSVVANVVRRFWVEFAAGEDGGACERETKDCFTLNVGKLDVRLTVRGEGGNGKA